MIDTNTAIHSGFSNTINEVGEFFRKYESMYKFKKDAVFSICGMINQIALSLPDIFPKHAKISVDTDEIDSFLASDLESDIREEELFPMFYCQNGTYSYQIILLVQLENNQPEPGIMLMRSDLDGNFSVYHGADQDGNHIWENLEGEMKENYASNFSLFAKASDDFANTLSTSVYTNEDETDDETLQNTMFFYASRYMDLIKLHSATLARTKIKAINSKDSLGLPDFALTSKVSPTMNIGIIEKEDGFYAYLINDNDFKKAIFDPQMEVYKNVAEPFLADSVYCYSDKMTLRQAAHYIEKYFPAETDDKPLSTIYIPKEKWQNGILRLRFDTNSALKEMLLSNEEIKAKANEGCMKILKNWVLRQPDALHKEERSVTDIS